MHTAHTADTQLTAQHVPCSGPRRTIINCPDGTGRGIPHGLDWDRYVPGMLDGGGPLDATEYIPVGSHWTLDLCVTTIIYAGDLRDGA